jgi:Na+/alanine symporter
MLDFDFIVLSAVFVPIVFAIGLILIVKMRFASIASFAPTDNVKQTEISPLQAHMLSLSISTFLSCILMILAVNLVGVATIFWMWVGALLALVFRYCELVLSAKYRQNYQGYIIGGAMGSLGSSPKTRPLAIMFAVCAIWCTFLFGSFAQSGFAVLGMERYFDLNRAQSVAMLLFVSSIIIVAGVRYISAAVTAIMIAAMVIFVLGVFFHPTDIAQAWHLAIQNTFSGSTSAIFLGFLCGGGVVLLPSLLGNAGIFYSMSAPKKQSLLPMMEPLVSAVVCTVAALAALGVDTEHDSALDMLFDSHWFALMCLFALASILSSAIVCGRCGMFLFGVKSSRMLRTLFALVIAFAAFWDPHSVVSYLWIYPLMSMINVVSILYRAREISQQAPIGLSAFVIRTLKRK